VYQLDGYALNHWSIGPASRNGCREQKKKKQAMHMIIMREGQHSAGQNLR
jgi:hypothetical protein